MNEISLPKAMNMICTDDGTMNLFLFLCRTTIDWILILMVNFKEFTAETAIS